MKLLKKITIVCIIAIIIVLILNIYDNIILPNIYNSNSQGTIVEDNDKYELCRKAIIKYILAVEEKTSNIDNFYPFFKRSSEKNDFFKKNLENMQGIRTNRLYELGNNVYMMEYTIKNFGDSFYKCIIKFYPLKNYYVIMSDELYESKKEV